MTRTRRKRLRAVPGSIGPTPERLAKVVGLDEMSEAMSSGMTRKTGAIRVWSALENLYRNRLISPEQHQAGERYYRDWYLGFMASAQVTMKWSDYVSGLGGGGGGLDAAERKAFHAKRYAAANGQLEALGVRKPVHWLVINDIKPQDVGHRFRGYRGKDKASAAGTTVVALGLQLLAKFYGLVK
jgi:hypothetical protein